MTIIEFLEARIAEDEADPRGRQKAPIEVKIRCHICDDWIQGTTYESDARDQHKAMCSRGVTHALTTEDYRILNEESRRQIDAAPPSKESARWLAECEAKRTLMGTAPHADRPLRRA